MGNDDKVQIAVTPPRMDTPQMRQWIESKASEDGWDDLEWRDDADHYGAPMARLFGARRP
jgi:hypothetical protein